MAQFEAHARIEKAGEKLDRTASVRLLNNLFIELSKIRLREEIHVLERGLSQTFPKPWMKEAEQKRLADKRAALADIEELQKQLKHLTLTEPALDQIHFSEMVRLAELQRLEKATDSGLTNKVQAELREAEKQVARAIDELKAEPESPLQIEQFKDIIEKLPEWLSLAEQHLDSASGQSLKTRLSTLRALERQQKRMQTLREIVEGELKANTQRNKEANRFLSATGASAEGSKASSVDLSSQFSAPLSQGHLFSCVAHALTSDMSTYMPEAPSANYAYALTAWAQTLLEGEVGADKLNEGKVDPKELAKAINEVTTAENFPANLRETWKTIAAADGHQGPLYEYANKGLLFDLAQAVASKHGLPLEKDYPSKSDDFIPVNINTVPQRTYALSGVQRMRNSLTEKEMKQLLRNNQPFQVVLATDARYIKEDWVIPDAHAGSIAHVFNVVGFSKGIDPNDNQEKLYFNIRDSFTPANYHYKISVDSLIPLNVESLRVTGVTTLKEPIKYESVKLPN